jgi:FkbM family methyltransferase
MISSEKINEINSFAMQSSRLPVDVSGKQLLEHMKKNPFYGFVDVTPPGGGGFVMLNLNDCAVSSKIFWTGRFSYEPGSLAIWRMLCRNSNTIVDCGAYTGIYSLVAASVNRGASIFAFEPVSFIRARLSKNAIINNCTKIKVYSFALGYGSETIDLNIPFGPEVFSSGTSIVYGKKSDTIEVVKVDSYDNLNLPPPDLIKIDAEGAEDIVLQGMKNSLVENPFILSEVLDRREPESLLKYLPIGYQFFFVKESGSMVLTTNFDEWRNSGGLNVIYYHPDKRVVLAEYLHGHY